VTLDLKSLGARITRLRELRGLSLGALAEAAGGMAKSYLARIERGEVESPGLRLLSAIAGALGVTVADLLAPAEQGRGATGEALLEQLNDFDQVMATLPPGLEEFINRMAAERNPLPPDAIRALALAQFRGRRPHTHEDWRFLYDALLRSIRSPQ
jgi:transcriptional regulator with XRE-family HTH domain